MVEKLCIKIGQFILYCLKLCEREEENKMEITPNLINEWLYGGANNE